MEHLFRTHSAISKKMVIIPNTPSNEEIEGEGTPPQGIGRFWIKAIYFFVNKV